MMTTETKTPVPTEPVVWKVASIVNATAVGTLQVTFDAPMRQANAAADAATRDVRAAIAKAVTELESTDAYLELARIRDMSNRLDADLAAVADTICECQTEIARQVKAGGEPTGPESRLTKAQSTHAALVARQPTVQQMMDTAQRRYDELRRETIHALASKLRADASNRRRDAQTMLANAGGPALTAYIRSQAGLMALSDDAVKRMAENG